MSTEGKSSIVGTQKFCSSESAILYVGTFYSRHGALPIWLCIAKRLEVGERTRLGQQVVRGRFREKLFSNFDESMNASDRSKSFIPTMSSS